MKPAGLRLVDFAVVVAPVVVVVAAAAVAVATECFGLSLSELLKWRWFELHSCLLMTSFGSSEASAGKSAVAVVSAAEPAPVQVVVLVDVAVGVVAVAGWFVESDVVGAVGQ